jgi:hypothetical protein
MRRKSKTYLQVADCLFIALVHEAKVGFRGWATRKTAESL